MGVFPDADSRSPPEAASTAGSTSDGSPSPPPDPLDELEALVSQLSERGSAKGGTKVTSDGIGPHKRLQGGGGIGAILESGYEDENDDGDDEESRSLQALTKLLLQGTKKLPRGNPGRRGEASALSSTRPAGRQRGAVADRGQDKRWGAELEEFLQEGGDEDDLDEEEELARLQGALSDDALRAIKVFELEEEEEGKAWQFNPKKSYFPGQSYEAEVRTRRRLLYCHCFCIPFGFCWSGPWRAPRLAAERHH